MTDQTTATATGAEAARGSFLRIGFIFALGCGVLDPLLNASENFDWIDAMAPLGLNALIAFAAWCMIAPLLRLRPGGGRHPHADRVALAAALLGFFAVAVRHDLLNAVLTRAVLRGRLIEMLTYVTVAAAAGLYTRARLLPGGAAAENSALSRRATALGPAVPFLLLALFQLSAVIRGAEFRSMPGVAWLVLFALLAGFVWLRLPGFAPVRRTAFFAFFFALAVLGGAGSFLRHLHEINRPAPHAVSADPAGRGVRHVILLSIDTLRADHLSCYGAPGEVTPAIDSLAADGVVYETAIAGAPWTLPSVISFQTGLSPVAHGVVSAKSRLAENHTTLAEDMAASGYRTAAIAYNPYLIPVYNLDQGYQYYLTFGRGSPFGTAMIDPVFKMIANRMDYQARLHESTEKLSRQTGMWLGENAADDFFLWIHFFDPHVPYSPPRRLTAEPPASSRIRWEFPDAQVPPNALRSGSFAPTLTERERIHDLYRSEIRYVDEHIERVIKRLKELGIYDDALIVLTSDHGEEFWEHDAYEHGHSVYNEVVRVPLIVKLPGGREKGRVARPVSLMSIVPTVLEASRPPSETGPWQHPERFRHRSLFREGKLLHEDAAASAPPLSTGTIYYEDKLALLADGFKYIRSAVTGREELYDLAADPGEKRSVAGERPEILERLRTAAEEEVRLDVEILREIGGQADAAGLDAETVARLKALGYM